MTTYVTKEQLGKFSELIMNKYGIQKEIVVNINIPMKLDVSKVELENIIRSIVIKSLKK